MSEPTKFGRLQSGEELTSGSNFGEVVLMQSAIVNFDATLVQSVRFTLPVGAQILDAWFDPLVLYNSATTATGSIGSAAGGTQYGGSMDLKTAARKRPTLTIAQADAMDDIGANTSVFFTVTSVGPPTAGSARATILYRIN